MIITEVDSGCKHLVASNEMPVVNANDLSIRTTILNFQNDPGFPHSGMKQSNLDKTGMG